MEQNFKKCSHVAAKEWKKIAAKYFSDHLVLIKMFLVGPAKFSVVIVAISGRSVKGEINSG